jgi:hypothetical protein
VAAVVELNQKEQMKSDNERAGTPAVAVQRFVSHDWFKANVAGACEGMMMLHYALCFPLAMCGHKWGGTFLLVAGCWWMCQARSLREKHAVEKARREWQREKICLHG